MHREAAFWLRFREEENNCLNCHSGAVASMNIAADIGKRSGHDVRRYHNAHDPKEIPFTMRRHVECVDCHNPHAVVHNPLGIIQGTLGRTVKGPSLLWQSVQVITLPTRSGGTRLTTSGLRRGPATG